MSDKSHLNVCKRALYLAIWRIPPNKMSTSDAEIGFALMKDPYIQNLLDDSREKDKKNHEIN